MSNFTSLVGRFSSSISNSIALNLRLPWDGLSGLLLGNAANGSRRRRRNGRSRSRNRNRGRPTVIPPPHSHALRRQDIESLEGEGSRASDFSRSSILFNRQSCQNGPFGYSMLDSRRAVSPFEDLGKNVFAALMSILVIATLATALAQPRWFSVKGGSCAKPYIGLQEFFYISTFKTSATTQLDAGNLTQNSNRRVYYNSVNSTKISDRRELTAAAIGDTLESTANQASSLDDIAPKRIVANPDFSQQLDSLGVNSDLKQCVTPEIIAMQRTIIALCFLAIVANLIQFFLDTLGTSRKWVNAVRTHAVGSIVGVIFVIIIIGVSYHVSSLLEKEQEKGASPDGPSNHVEVRFELSYYLITLAGLIGLLAASCNLLRKPSHFYFSPSDLSFLDGNDPYALLDDDLSPPSIWTHSSPSNFNHISPPLAPPPYSP